MSSFDSVLSQKCAHYLEKSLGIFEMQEMTRVRESDPFGFGDVPEKWGCGFVRPIIDAVHDQGRHGDVLGALYGRPALYCSCDI